MSMLKKYKTDTAANMSVIFALCMGTVLMGVGAAVDINQLTSTRTKAADVADGMALAAAMAAREGKTRAERVELGREAALAVYDSNKAALTGATLHTPDIDINDDTKDVTITIKADVDYSLMGLFGQKSSVASADSVVSYKIDTIPPISMAFAFDTSGSMGWAANGDPSRSKMEVLQEATELLFDAMESEAEEPALLKAAFSTTFSSYNTAIVDSEDWSYGAQSIDDIIDYVDAMVPDGGTNSTPSMQFVYDQMVANRPVNHPQWRGYVLFMTDGANNDTAVENPATLALCEALRDDPSITVITVAFSAPVDGQELLEECASDGKYYESDNAAEIKKDFAKIGREIGEVVFRLKS